MSLQTFADEQIDSLKAYVDTLDLSPGEHAQWGYFPK